MESWSSSGRLRFSGKMEPSSTVLAQQMSIVRFRLRYLRTQSLWRKQAIAALLGTYIGFAQEAFSGLNSKLPLLTVRFLDIKVEIVGSRGLIIRVRGQAEGLKCILSWQGRRSIISGSANGMRGPHPQPLSYDDICKPAVEEL